jgi:hypothetical protein
VMYVRSRLPLVHRSSFMTPLSDVRNRQTRWLMARRARPSSYPGPCVDEFEVVLPNRAIPALAAAAPLLVALTGLVAASTQPERRQPSGPSPPSAPSSSRPGISSEVVSRRPGAGTGGTRRQSASG